METCKNDQGKSGHPPRLNIFWLIKTRVLVVTSTWILSWNSYGSPTPPTYFSILVKLCTFEVKVSEIVITDRVPVQILPKKAASEALLQYGRRFVVLKDGVRTVFFPERHVLQNWSKLLFLVAH